MNDEIMPKDFLQGYHDVADPPFCFRCGNRKRFCTCDQPMTKQEWFREWRKRDQANTQP